MEQRVSVDEWRERIGEYRTSGLSARVWCERAGESIWRLRYWINRINKIDAAASVAVCSKGSSRWSRVELGSGGNNGTSSGIRICMGAARIELNSGFDRSALAQVLSVVAGLC